ncbi:MAG: hypothetical protein ACHQZQ_00005 [SAR324 cluster bacterium]
MEPIGTDAGRAVRPLASDKQVIERFLAGWAPYAGLPAESALRTALTRFFAAESPAERREALERINPAGRLQRIYAELGIARNGGDPAEEVLALNPQALAAAIRGSATQEPLALLQKHFEFGRTPPAPNTQAARRFLLEFWAMTPGAPPMKYCVYAGGLPFSAGGKSHEEAAREFIRAGYGSGNPLCGGLIVRRAPLAFEFDTSTTLFRSGMRPDEVKQGILRWIRATGGDETKVNLVHDERSVG